MSIREAQQNRSYSDPYLRCAVQHRFSTRSAAQHRFSIDSASIQHRRHHSAPFSTVQHRSAPVQHEFSKRSASDQTAFSIASASVQHADSLKSAPDQHRRPKLFDFQHSIQHGVQHVISTRSAHHQLMISTRSARDQHALSSRSALSRGHSVRPAFHSARVQRAFRATLLNAHHHPASEQSRISTGSAPKARFSIGSASIQHAISTAQHRSAPLSIDTASITRANDFCFCEKSNREDNSKLVSAEWIFFPVSLWQPRTAVQRRFSTRSACVQHRSASIQHPRG
jgi:hypothetical protein